MLGFDAGQFVVDFQQTIEQQFARNLTFTDRKQVTQSFHQAGGFCNEPLPFLHGMFGQLDAVSGSWILGDINNDSLVNVLDIVLIVNFILMTDEPTDAEFYVGDVNSDGQLNVLDVVAIVQMILNPEASIQIYSGTSLGWCSGYCSHNLELDNGSVSFISSGFGVYGDDLTDIFLVDNLNQDTWQQLVELIDFEYFQSLDDIYGYPYSDDASAEYIEIIYNGVSKEVIFDADSEVSGIEELTLLLRELREDYWNQLNEPQLPESCYLEPDGGPCFGYMPMYYYNLISNLSKLRKPPIYTMNDNRLSIIVAYRDPGDGTRREQLDIFLQQMQSIFNNKTSYHIYIIEQESERDDYDILENNS